MSFPSSAASPSASSSSKHKLQDTEVSSSMSKKQKKQKSNSDKGKGKEKEKSKLYKTPEKDQAILSYQDVGIDGEKDQGIGPVIASFGEFEPPSVPYNLFNSANRYRRITNFKRAEDPEGQDAMQAHPLDKLILQGETEEMSYFSGNYSEGFDSRGYPGEYLVGIHDPETSTITLKAAPLLRVSRSVKALASEPTVRKTATGNMFEDRRALGEAFGNKKQKQNARNQDRMKVNLSEDKGVESEAIMNRVMGEIAEATKGMQGAGEVKLSSDAGRSIPKPNMQAQSPEDAYPINDLIGGQTISNLLTQATDLFFNPNIAKREDITPLLPVAGPGKSSYILNRILEASERGRKGGAGFISSSSPSSSSKSKSKSANNDSKSHGLLVTSTSKTNARLRMKVLVYISLLWCFWKLNDKLKNGRSVGENEKREFLEKLKLKEIEGGEMILDDLFGRFTENQRGSNKSHFTSQKEAFILAHIFALTLHLDNFSVDVNEIANQMNLDPAKATELFKALGCRAKTATMTKKDAVTGDITTVKSRKMALEVPIVLPVPRKIPAKR